jgi:hypothetical protein
VGAAVALFALSACGRSALDGATAVPTGTPPVQLTGQRVLVLPVQITGLAGPSTEVLDGEIGFALVELDSRVSWVTPEELRRAVRRSPMFAGDPGALPGDALVRHGERRVVEPLAGELRRYSALVDARLVILPRLRRAAPLPDGTEAVRLTGELIDARSGDVVWWAELPIAAAELESRSGLAELAGRFAQRLLASSPSGSR